jgi:hypothetical protein
MDSRALFNAVDNLPRRICYFAMYHVEENLR